jgi:uncharacterized membrane protein
MKYLLRLYTFFVLVLISLASQAQGMPSATMADTMRSNGKIYVVIAVLLTIMAGIVFYLVRLDKKITKLEKES